VVDKPIDAWAAKTSVPASSVPHRNRRLGTRLHRARSPDSPGRDLGLGLAIPRPEKAHDYARLAGTPGRERNGSAVPQLARNPPNQETAPLQRDGSQVASLRAPLDARAEPGVIDAAIEGRAAARASERGRGLCRAPPCRAQNTPIRRRIYWPVRRRHPPPKERIANLNRSRLPNAAPLVLGFRSPLVPPRSTPQRRRPLKRAPLSLSGGWSWAR
jgi:hypothetical protein